VLAAVLFAEYAGLAVAFDVAHWLKHLGLLEELRFIRHAGPAFLTGLAATAIVGGSALASDLVRALRVEGPPPRRLPWIGAHLALLSCLVALSFHLFVPPFPEGLPPAVWMVLWLATGLLTVWSLSRALVPWRGLVSVLRTHLKSIVIGASIAGLAFAAGKLTEPLWDVMARPTLVVISTVASLVLPVVVDFDTRVLGTPRFLVEMEPACSGYEGVGLILVFLGGYLALFRERLRFPAVLWLLPIGIATMWTSNILRIVLLLVIGHYVSSSIALNGFHANLGWLMFIGVALGLLTWAQRSPTMHRDAVAARTEDAPLTRSDTAAYLLPLLSVILATLVTGLFTVDVDWLYGVRVLAGGLVLYHVRDLLPAPRWPPSLTPVALGVLVFAVWIGLAPGGSGGETREALATAGPLRAAAWIALRVIGSVVLVPIVEELAFRGYLLRRAQSIDFTRVPLDRMHLPGILLSSVAFGMLHQMVVAGTVAGVLFGFAQLRRGRIADAVIAHVVANALVAIAVLGFGRWDLW
jgi:exosortase E/protease (VPEID-CTERM system)